MAEFTTNSIMLDEVTEDTTSNYFDLSLRKKKGIEILLEDIKGEATVEFQVSNDAVNFITYNRLNENLIDDNTENDTRIGIYTLDATTPSTYLTFPVGDHFRCIRAVYTTVDGAIVTYEIEDAGTDYEVDDEIEIDDGTGAIITVTEVGDNGEIVAFTLDDAGEDYTIGVHAGTGGSGQDFELNVLTVDSGTATAVLEAID